MENLFYGRKMARVGQKAQTELVQYPSCVSIRPDTPQIQHTDDGWWPLVTS